MNSIKLPFLFIYLNCVYFSLSDNDGVNRAIQAEHNEENGLQVPILKNNLDSPCKNVEIAPLQHATYDLITAKTKDIPMDNLLPNLLDDKHIIIMAPPEKITNDNIYQFALKKVNIPNQDHKYDFNTIKMSDTGDTRAYYVAAKKSITIPVHPTENDPKYLFTDSFAGCSLVVDRLTDLHADKYKVYHVFSNHEYDYNNVYFDDRLGQAASLEYKDYGYHKNNPLSNNKLMENRAAVAFMKYSKISKRWEIHYQKTSYPAEISNRGIYDRTAPQNELLIKIPREIKVLSHEFKPVMTTTQTSTALNKWRLANYHDLLNPTGCKNALCLFSTKDIEKFVTVDKAKMKMNFDGKKFLNLLYNSNNPNMNAQLIEYVNEHRIYDKHYRTIVESLHKNEIKTFGPGKVRQKIVEAQEQRKVNLANCLAPTRRKRSTTNKFCRFSLEDFKKFSSEQKVNGNHLENLKIDTKKFVEFMKKNSDTKMNKQLLQLIDHNYQKIEFSNNNYKGVLKQMFIHGDNHALAIDRRMNHFAGTIYDDKRIKYRKVINNVGKYTSTTMLVHGIYSTSKKCLQNGVKVDCVIGVSSLTWSIASGHIEKYALEKFAPKIANKVMTASQFIMNILPETRALQLFSKTFSKTLVKSVGVLGVGFDVYDITQQVKTLIECDKRKNTENQCSEQMYRDSIASLVFDGISIVAGVALVTFPVAGLIVSSIIFAIQIIYNGISLIIEYKKYDTTTKEDIQLFLTSIIGEKPAFAVDIDFRQNLMDSRAKVAWQMLNQGGANSSVLAYGLGLGHLENNNTYSPYFGHIVLNKADGKNKIVSRVQPSELKDAEFICLATDTKLPFENGRLKTVNSAVYFCSNAMVLRHAKRKGDTVIFDLALINWGSIYGSNVWNNNFLIHSSTEQLYVWGGNDVNNTFTILNNGIAAKIHGGKNSSNTFDMRFNEYPTNGQNISAKCFNDGFYHLHFVEQKLFVRDIFEGHWTTRYHYLGKPYHADDVSCVDESCGITTVNTGGGAENNYDRINYCTNAIMSPFTEIYSNSPLDHTIYVKTNGYNGKNLNSKINIQFGKIIILFTEFDLINDAIFMYKHKNDVLRINLYFGNSNFTISISDFQSEGRLGEIFFLNKYQQYVRLKFLESSEQSETEITTFERHAKCPNDLLNNNNLQNCIDQIEIPDRLKMLSIFEVENSGKFIVGSKYNDVIAFDDKTAHAKGGEGSDIYIVGDNNSNNVTIVNYANDETLDFLVMSKVPHSYAINDKNMLNVKIKSFNSFMQRPIKMCLFCTNSNTTQKLLSMLKKLIYNFSKRPLIS